jgi:hypothetical protein
VGIAALLLALTLLSATAPLQLALSASVDSAQLYSEIGSTFARVHTIEGEGGNVTGVVGQLNQALAFVATGEAYETTAPDQAQALYQQAEFIIQSVNQELPGVESQGIAAAQSEVSWLAFTLAALAAIGIGIYFFGGRIFWSLWIRSHRNWRVKKS